MPFALSFRRAGCCWPDCGKEIAVSKIVEARCWRWVNAPSQMRSSDGHRGGQALSAIARVGFARSPVKRKKPRRPPGDWACLPLGLDRLKERSARGGRHPSAVVSTPGTPGLCG